MAIKLHDFEHGAAALRFIIPKRASTYMFEALLGKLAKVGRGVA